MARKREPNSCSRYCVKLPLSILTDQEAGVGETGVGGRCIGGSRVAGCVDARRLGDGVGEGERA